MKKVFAILVSVLTLVATPSLFGKTSKPLSGELTKKQVKALEKFEKIDTLVTHLMKVPGRKNRFNKNTVYVMKNFIILQKLKGGYLVTANDPTGSGIEYSAAFLATGKSLPQSVVITSFVVYSGEYKYTATNGYEQSVPKFKIAAGLPVSGVRIGGDPFKREYF